MNITIKDLTKEQADNIEAFAHAVKTQSIQDIEINMSGEWEKKYTNTFYPLSRNRVKPQPSYLDLHKASGLKVGDRVKVTREAEDNEGGWKNLWDEEMDSYVGKVCQINNDYRELGFSLIEEDGCDYFSFPYFVLEKIEEEWIVKFFFNNRWVLDELIYPSKEAAQTGLAGSDSKYEIIKIK